MPDGPNKLLPFPKVPPLVKGAALAVGVVVASSGCTSPMPSGLDGATPPMPGPDANAFLPRDANMPPPMPAPMVDAGPPLGDGGPVDAGPVDAGPVDAGPVDAGPVDAGPVDAGPVDAGTAFDGGIIAPMPPPEPDGGPIIVPPMPPPMPAPDPDF